MQRQIHAPDAPPRLGQRPATPPEQVLLSSRGRDWTPLILEQHARPATEHAVPALDEHTLLLVLGQPVQMVQQRDGRTDTRQVGAGDLLLAPADMEALCRWDATLSLLQLRIPQRTLTQVAAEAAMTGAERLELVNQFCVRDAFLEGLVLALRAELLANDPGGRLVVDSLTNLLAVQLLRRYSNLSWPEPRAAARAAPPLRRATDYINDNLHADLSLAELAATVSLSPYHFARIFKRAFGLSPHQYVIRQRVEQARQLLESTPQTVGEVAAAVGFYDQGHLARHMRRLLGVAPHALKNRTNLR